MGGWGPTVRARLAVKARWLRPTLGLVAVLILFAGCDSHGFGFRGSGATSAGSGAHQAGVSLPSLKLPTVTVPRLSLPAVHVTLPPVTVPVTVPGVTVPGVTVPGVTVPDVTGPGATGPGAPTAAPTTSIGDGPGSSHGSTRAGGGSSHGATSPAAARRVAVGRLPSFHLSRPFAGAFRGFGSALSAAVAELAAGLMVALIALVIGITTGAVAVAIVPFVLLIGFVTAIMTAEYGLAGVAISIGFGLLSIFLRTLVILWLALFVAILTGLLGASGAILALVMTAIWVARLIQRRRALGVPANPAGRGCQGGA